MKIAYLVFTLVFMCYGFNKMLGEAGVLFLMLCLLQQVHCMENNNGSNSYEDGKCRHFFIDEISGLISVV